MTPDRPRIFRAAARSAPWRGPWGVLLAGAALAVVVVGVGLWMARGAGHAVSVPDRTGQLILIGLLLVCVSDRRIRWARGALWDWSPLVVIALSYEFVRTRAADLALDAHVLPQMHFDQFLFGTNPTVWLQDRLHVPGQLGALDYAAWTVHLSHFVVPVVVAATLWRRHHAGFRLFATSLTCLTLAGYLTYLAMPAVPPWMASQIGALEPTVRITAEIWAQTGIDPLARTFEGGNGLANDVGALPSLHAAYPALLLLLFWRGAGTGVRIALLSYPLVMSFALVYGAEHYVADILLGWLYAALTALIALAVNNHRMRV